MAPFVGLADNIVIGTAATTFGLITLVATAIAEVPSAPLAGGR